MRLQNQVALVTGAGRGMGRAIVRRFVQEGADIAALEIDPETLRSVTEEVQSMGRKCVALQADLAKVDQIQSAVQKAMDAFGKIDILVNNAGVSKAMGLFEITEKDWDHMQDINLKGLFFMTQAVAKHMVAVKRGKIINISSIGGKAWWGTVNAAYAAGKGGVIVLTKVTSRLLGPDNINVNAICPGITITEMSRKNAEIRAQKQGITTEEFIKNRELTIPIQRSCVPEDIADMAVFLASEESKNVTGQAINLDGGIMP